MRPVRIQERVGEQSAQLYRGTRNRRRVERRLVAHTSEQRRYSKPGQRAEHILLVERPDQHSRIGRLAMIGGLSGISKDVPPYVMVVLTCGGLTFLTELTSNTATTEMILPILASVAVAIKTNPLLLMIPATLSASCAFMMPVATPPNAIVFSSGEVEIRDMVRAGLVLRRRERRGGRSHPEDVVLLRDGGTDGVAAIEGDEDGIPGGVDDRRR